MVIRQLGQQVPLPEIEAIAGWFSSSGFARKITASFGT